MSGPATTVAWQRADTNVSSHLPRYVAKGYREANVFKGLREWWMYWRYRNITRRWQLLKPRLRLRRQAPVNMGSFRPRGAAAYMPTRRGNGRGLLFVAAVAAVLAVVNALLNPPFALDILLLAGMTYAYLQFGGV